MPALAHKTLFHSLVVLFILLLPTIDGVVVQSLSGKLRGATSPTFAAVTRFLGIPFANPPKRLEKGELVTPWSGMFS